MARRKAHVSALDNLREALQIMPVKRAVAASDRRSIDRSRRLVKELESQKPSRVAAELQISTQKYVAIRRQVREGKVSSSTLNALLEQTNRELEKNVDLKRAAAALPHAKEGEYISEAPVRGKRKFKIEYEYASQKFLKKKLPWATNIKPGGFASLQSVLNWYGGVTGGKEYFWIVKGKSGKYYVYDVRTPSEKTESRKGGVSGELRAQKIMEKYEGWHDQYDEFEDEIFEDFGEDFGEEFDEDYEDELEDEKPRRKNVRSKGKRTKGARGGKSKTKKGARRGGPKKGRSVAAGYGKKAARSRKAR